MNTTASISIGIATLFDLAVWYYAKDLEIFDVKQESSTGSKLTDNVMDQTWSN